MASRNQNRPPRSLSTKNEDVDDIPLVKRRRIGTGRMVGQAGTGGTRQPFGVVNRQDVTATSDICSTEGLDCEPTEFSKEEVETLLNEKPKAKKFDLKAKLEQMTEHNKRLKLCVKWFQQVDEKHLLEEERLWNASETAEKKFTDYEAEMKNKEAEYIATISELRENNASLQDKVAKDESEKLDTIDRHRREVEARVATEKLQASLSEELDKAQQEIVAANQKAASIDDMYKHLQEYTTSLHQYNVKLQNDLEKVRESLKHVEKDKSTIVENLRTLRGHYNSLQDQLTLSRSSQDEAVNQKESLLNEVKCLRGELQQVR